MATDLNTATLQRDAGMALALANAEKAIPTWSDLAFAFLCRFARSHREFISEDVSDAAKAWGMIEPPTLKAWGPVYVRAARGGIISQCGVGRSRCRHASITILWRSHLFSGEAA